MKPFPLIPALIALTLSEASLAALPAKEANVNAPALVPWPKQIETGRRTYKAPAKLVIEIDGPGALSVGETLAGELHELGFETAVHGLTERPTPFRLMLLTAREARPGDEGYRLTIGRVGIGVTASSDRGLFWGTRTALQLLAGGPGSRLPELTITDAPEYAYRAAMVDVARQFHTLDFHKWMIRTLARYKLNVYHVHFTDDQSWTLPSDAFPGLPTPDRHYTKDEIKELVEYAARYHITIVPEIDLPGHATALCAAVPDVVCQGKEPSNVVCAGSETSYAAIETILSEAIDLFPGPYFHIGADEVNAAVWDGCPACAAAVEQAGYDDYQSLYNHFINRMNAFVESKGKTMIVWEGFDPTRKPPVDADVIVQQWWNGYVRPEANLEAGHTLINASWAPLYLVLSTVNPPEIIAQWHPRLFGAGVNVQPVDAMIRLDADAPILGTCMCSWENSEASEPSLFVGEGEQLDGYAVPAPRLQAFAERAWCGDRTDADDLLARIKHLDKVDWPAPVLAADGTPLLPVREPIEVAGGRVITSWPTYGENAPERAFDGKDDTFFWSARPAQVGDTFTLVLDEAKAVKHVHLAASQPERPDDYVHKGVIEVSADGTTFARAAEITEPETDAQLDGASIKAVRIRVTAGQPWWVAIRRFVVE